MNKRNKFVSGVVMLGILTAFSGCSWSADEGDKNPQETVKTALNNLSKIKSGGYEIAMDGKATLATESATGFNELIGSWSAGGVFDSSTNNDPKFTLKLAANGKVDGGPEQSIGAELAMVDKNFYFQISKLPTIGAFATYQSIIDQAVNKWWSIPLPPDVLEELNSLNKDEKDLTAEEKQLKDLFEKTSFFTDVKYEGDDKVGGVKSGKYSVKLDELAIKKYVEEVSKISNANLSEGEIVDMQGFFELMNFSGTVWVSKDDKMLVKIEGDMVVLPSEESGDMSVNLKITYEVENVNGDVKVEAPSGSTPFDIMMLLGGLGAGVSSEEVPGDPEATEELPTEEVEAVEVTE